MQMDYLNTSHVKVNVRLPRVTSLSPIDLNTSHVKVNASNSCFNPAYKINLNTSHVKVNAANTFPLPPAIEI